MVIEKSSLPFDYFTIKVTKSRINKGLLAIPVTLLDKFPQNKDKIYLVDDLGIIEVKSFTHYNSSSKECRIGSLKEFYNRNNVLPGEEIVLQFLEEDKYFITTEISLKQKYQEFFLKIENEIDDEKAEELLKNLAKFANIEKQQLLKNEFIRLSSTEITDRNKIQTKESKQNEKTPILMRKILLELYKGKCQISDFTFTTKYGNLYFEVHHIAPEKGIHFKNLLVVSPNIHSQFTHCNVAHQFDSEGWLRKVKFNDIEYNVFQIIDKLPKKFEKEIHF